MKKPVKLILVPFYTEVYEVGMLVDYNNKRERTLYEIDTITLNDDPNDHIKCLAWFGTHCSPDKYLNGSVSGKHPITVKPYIVSDDKIEVNELVLDTKANDTFYWTDKHEQFKESYDFCKKIIAEPNHIKCPDGYDNHSWLQSLKEISDKGGDCFIEMEKPSKSFGSYMGNFLGMETRVKLTNNKVTITLNK